MKTHPAKQNIKIAVDNCIFTIINNELHILLIQMKKKPFAKMWALPGGLIKANENLDKAALRVLKEETNVSDIYLEQLYTFGKAERDPLGRVISVAYFALIPFEGLSLKTLPKYQAVKWWKYSNMPNLAYDHNEIAKYAKKRLALKITYSNVVWSLLPEKFTLGQLQRVYEAILDKKIDKRNFIKKILSLDLIAKVGQKTLLGAYRPAELYRFKTKKPIMLDIL